MKKKLGMSLVLIFTVIVCLVFFHDDVIASENSFGVSPALIHNSQLLRGSHYEQQIILSRADPRQDAVAIIRLDESSVRDWISIKSGFEVQMPAGERRVPMIVEIDVPEDAALRDYIGNGNIRV